MPNGTEKLFDSVMALHDKFDKFREEYLREHAFVVSEVRRAHERVDRLEEDIKKVLAKIEMHDKYMPWLKAGAYLLTAISVPIVMAAIGFVWALLTHRIEFP